MTCPEEIKQMWEIVRESFRPSMSSAAFDMWYGNLTPTRYDPDQNVLEFDIKSEFFHKRLSEHHKPLLEAAFLSEAGMDISLRFCLVGGQVPPIRIPVVQQAAPEPVQPEPPTPTAPLTNLPVQINKYTFENFIEGGSNKFARAACWRVANNPFNEYNPLFIYGPSGVGKTHLMYAVINEMKRQNPGVRVVYTKGDDFINNMVEHITHKTMSAFHDFYRGCDVLLIDDIQFIAGKVGMQNEVFHTFQALFDEGKQIILASDRPPKDINPLEERLRSRFEGGLLADINLPDLELRIAIIKKKAEDLSLNLPNEVLMFLAENLRSNIRQIEGVIKKLAAISILDGRHVTLDVSRDILLAVTGDAEPLEVTINKIFAAVVKKFGISKEDIIGQKRAKEIMIARHTTVYLIREITELSLKRIGALMDNRDHASILHSYNTAKQTIVKNPLYQADIDELKKEICGN
jgi:chromosomal replication initiator protein